MAKNVYLKKKIGEEIHDIYPHTDAAIVHYTKEGSGSTTVADELDTLAKALEAVITSGQVDEKITAATNELYNKIMGIAITDSTSINEAYDTLKEVAEYLEEHEDVVSGFTSDISDLKSAVNTLEETVGNFESGLVKDVTDLKETIGDNVSGIVKDIEDLKDRVGSEASGLVKDVTDLKESIGDAESGLVKDVEDLKTSVANAGGVYVVSSAPSVEDASDNALYIVVDSE